jgi:hypothetical protein
MNNIMSYTSSTSNYGGSVSDRNQTIKRFIVGTPRNLAIWKNTSYNSSQAIIGSGAFPPLNKIVLTPVVSKSFSNNDIPVYISTDLYVSGTIYGTIATPSDQKLKDNIQSISEIKTQNLKNLEPKEFSYNGNNGKKHYGFIAQDIEKIYPELVNNNNTYKTINYIEIIPILVSKINRMQKEIDELSNFIKK